MVVKGLMLTTFQNPAIALTNASPAKLTAATVPNYKTPVFALLVKTLASSTTTLLKLMSQALQEKKFIPTCTPTLRRPLTLAVSL